MTRTADSEHIYDQIPITSLFVTSINAPPLAEFYVTNAKRDKCWSNLIQRESGWHVDAVNPASGACSLAQALPCNKIQGDWRDPEVALKWMADYIVERYGTTCEALKFQIKNNWY